jgi:hypothetical protein
MCPETNVKLTLFELAVGPREISREVVLGGMTMPSNVTNAILAVCHAKENMPTIEQFRSFAQHRTAKENENTSTMSLTTTMTMTMTMTTKLIIMILMMMMIL